jgi:carbonic anhydrase
MEMHLVHKDAAGKLAVVGVMIQEGQAHPELALLWQHLPESPGRTEAVAGVQVNAARLVSVGRAASLISAPSRQSLRLDAPTSPSTERGAALSRIWCRALRTWPGRLRCSSRSRPSR